MVKANESYHFEGSNETSFVTNLANFGRLIETFVHGKLAKERNHSFYINSSTCEVSNLGRK